MSKKAKVLDEEQFDQLRAHIAANSPTPERDDLLVLLSFRAGLRAAEIAKISMTDMTDAENRIASVITITKHVGKKERVREIPMHPEIKTALERFRERYPDKGYVAVAVRDGSRMTPNNLTVWFWTIMRRAGFEGVSSHSGRRTFCTTLARRANRHNTSLRDVQYLMGHSRLETTQEYIELNHNTFDLVASLGN